MGLKFLRVHPLSKPEDGPVSRYLNRYLSSFVSRLLLKTNVTPNQVSIAISLFAIPILLSGLDGHIILAGFLFQLASILDGVDGEIARAKNLNTPFGAILDTLLDYWIDSIGVLALGLALLKEGMFSATFVLSLVTFTVAIRLISQFVVKGVPNTKAHIYRDTRDVVTFLIFIGAMLTGLLANSLWFVLALLFVNAWRLDNMFYRLLVFWRLSSITLKITPKLVEESINIKITTGEEILPEPKIGNGAI